MEFQSETTNPDVPIQHRKGSFPTGPTLAVGLLLNKGDKFKLKAFLMNSLRTGEPPQPVTIWKQCWVQQLLRWSTDTAKLPSAARQLQRASPRLCKLLSESITHLSFSGQDAASHFFFPATLQKEDRATLGCHSSSKMLRGLLAPGREQPCTCAERKAGSRGNLGAGGSEAAKAD